jgi:hypothetical protein
MDLPPLPHDASDDQRAIHFLAKTLHEICWFMESPMDHLPNGSPPKVDNKEWLEHAEDSLNMLFDTAANCQKSALKLADTSLRIRVLRLVRLTWEVLETPKFSFMMDEQRHQVIVDGFVRAARTLKRLLWRDSRILCAELEALHILGNQNNPSEVRAADGMAWQPTGDIPQAVVRLLEQGIEDVNVLQGRIRGLSHENARQIKRRWKQTKRGNGNCDTQ